MIGFRRRVAKLSCKSLRRVRIRLAIKIRQLDTNNIFQLLSPNRARMIKVLKSRLKYVNKVYRAKCRLNSGGSFLNQIGGIPIPPPSNATIPGQPYTSIPRPAGPINPIPRPTPPVLPPPPSVPFHTHNIVDTKIRRTGGPIASPYIVPVPRPNYTNTPGTIPTGNMTNTPGTIPTANMRNFSGNSTWFSSIDMK